MNKASLNSSLMWYRPVCLLQTYIFFFHYIVLDSEFSGTTDDQFIMMMLQVIVAFLVTH